jgi:hypothetical protein
MGEDNPGDPMEDVMAIPTSAVRSSEELGVSPSPTTDESSTIGSPIPPSQCSLDGSGGSANIGMAACSPSVLGRSDIEGRISCPNESASRTGPVDSDGGTNSSCGAGPTGAGSIRTSGTSTDSMMGFDEVGGGASGLGEAPSNCSHGITSEAPDSSVVTTISPWGCEASTSNEVTAAGATG